MAIEICTVGGFSEVGRNMSAVKVGNDAVILDMGIQVQKIVDFEEEGNTRADLSSEHLRKMGAVPNDHAISSWIDSVKAIAISHAHLDHLAAAPYLCNKYNAPLLGTPFTLEVLRNMLRDDNLKINNQIKTLNSGSKFMAGDLEVEFINITHSTPQTVLMAVHSKHGTVLYANDFKFDNHPVIGRKPDYERLKELGRENVKALIVESLYADSYRKTPSELVAKEMLKDVMLGTENDGHAVFVTCFASHIARLKSIIEFGRKMGRKVVLLGRSLMKYVDAAEKIGLVNFSSEVEIVGYGAKIKKKLHKIEKDGASSYLIVCTGGQGEPRSVLNKILNNTFSFYFQKEDSMIFSNRTIPVQPNLQNREKMEKRLMDYGVRIFKDIHTSGHASREDLRDFINMVNPEHIIPAHGDKLKLNNLADLAVEMGYKLGKTVHVMHDGQKIKLE